MHYIKRLTMLRTTTYNSVVLIGEGSRCLIIFCGKRLNINSHL